MQRVASGRATRSPFPILAVLVCAHLCVYTMTILNRAHFPNLCSQACLCHGSGSNLLRCSYVMLRTCHHSVGSERNKRGCGALTPQMSPTAPPLPAPVSRSTSSGNQGLEIILKLQWPQQQVERDISVREGAQICCMALQQAPLLGWSPRCWQILPALFGCSGGCRVGPRAVQGGSGKNLPGVRRVWLHLRRAMADQLQVYRRVTGEGAEKRLCRARWSQGDLSNMNVTMGLWLPLAPHALWLGHNTEGWCC